MFVKQRIFYLQPCRKILSLFKESFRENFIKSEALSRLQCRNTSITSLFWCYMQKLWVTLICISGSDRFYLNIEDMIGYKPVFFIKWCWMILTPGICAVSLTADTKSRAAGASATANNTSCRWRAHTFRRYSFLFLYIVWILGFKLRAVSSFWIHSVWIIKLYLIVVSV